MPRDRAKFPAAARKYEVAGLSHEFVDVPTLVEHVKVRRSLVLRLLRFKDRVKTKVLATQSVHRPECARCELERRRAQRRKRR